MTFKIDSKATISELVNGLSLSEISASASFGVLSNKASQNISDSIEANKDTSQYVTNLDLQSVQMKTAQANGTDGPRDISSQFLIEPLKAISPDSVVNNTIASNSTMAKGFVNKATEVLDKSADLSQNPDQINNQNLKDKLKAAGTKCATIAIQEATHGELAHGNSLTATHASQTIAANGLKLHSDSTIAARTPHFGLNAQDYHVQANNSAIIVSDLYVNQSGQSVSLVDESHVTQAKTGLFVASDALDHISTNLRNTGIEQYTSMGKTNSAIADETLVGISGGDINQTAYNSVSTRAAGSISIVASPSPLPTTPVSAMGEQALESAVEMTNEINIVAKGALLGMAAVSLSKAGALTTSSTNAMIAAGTNAVISGSLGTATISDLYNYIGTPDAGMIVSGGRVFMNTLPALFSAATVPEINELPSLPSLPQLATKDISSCLPSSSDQSSTDSSKDGSGKSAGNKGQTIYIKPDKNSSATNGDDEPAVLIPEGGSTTNPKQIPRELGQDSTVASTPGAAPSKLPGVSAIDKADKAQSEALSNASGNAALDMGGLSGASVNIYLEKQDESSGVNLSRALTEVPSSLSGILQDPKTLESVVATATKAGNVSPALLESVLSGVIPSQSLGEFNDPNLFRALYSVKGILSKGNIPLLSDFSEETNPEIANKAVKLITAYPNSIQPLLTILDQVTALPAIGLLEILTSVLSNFNIAGLDKFSGLLNLPNLISSGNIGGITNMISQYADLGPVGSILGSTDIQSLSQSLFSGDLSKVTSAFGSLVSSQISQSLPEELSGAVGGIQSILMNLQTGQAIDSNALISQISGVLSQVTGLDEIEKATEVYGNLQGLISGIQSGNITSALTGGNLQSLLSTALGAKNAGVIQQSFSLLQNALGTASAFAAVPELMNMMGEYKIPSLNQLANALSCLDLFNKVKSLIDQAKGLADSQETPEGGGYTPDVEDELDKNSGVANRKGNKKTAKFIELAPRMMQLINSVKLVPPTDFERSADIQRISSLEIPYTLDPCYRVPRLTIAESMVTVLEVKNNKIVFTFPNLELLTREIRFYPKVGDMIQLHVAGFKDKSEFLTPYQTNFQYTPSIYNFIITEFDLESNKGIAVSSNTSSSIILEDSSGILLEYSPQSIGIQLSPVILESYLLA